MSIELRDEIWNLIEKYDKINKEEILKVEKERDEWKKVVEKEAEKIRVLSVKCHDLELLLSKVTEENFRLKTQLIGHDSQDKNDIINRLIKEKNDLETRIEKMHKSKENLKTENDKLDQDNLRLINDNVNVVELISDVLKEARNEGYEKIVNMIRSRMKKIYDRKNVLNSQKSDVPEDLINFDQGKNTGTRDERENIRLLISTFFGLKVHSD